MFGSNRTQQSSEDTRVIIDGRTGRVITDDRDDRDDRRDNGQGRQERGSAHWIHDEYGNKTTYYPGQEW